MIKLTCSYYIIMAHSHLFIDTAEVNIKLKHYTYVYTCRLESYIAVQWESGVMGFLLVAKRVSTKMACKSSLHSCDVL